MKLEVIKKPENNKKDYINRNNLNEPKEGVLFVDFIEKILARKVKRVGKSYIGNYKTLINHLNNFSYKYNAYLYTNSINENFLDDFIVYLEESNLRLNYIRGLLELAKAMVRKAAVYGYAVDHTYDNVNVDEEESFAIYLSTNEITRIYYYNGLSKKQSRIRDLFILGCLTGLRYSDYSTLTKSNFQDNYIVKITQKTKKKVIIPMHDIVREIYLKYNGNIPSNISIQHFNRYIKLICKKVGINSKVVLNYTIGGKLYTENKEKWELISSHTARRSAATNMYLTGRMKTYEIMAITGHTTEKSFFRYIRTTTEDKIKQISNDIYFKI